MDGGREGVIAMWCDCRQGRRTEEGIVPYPCSRRFAGPKQEICSPWASAGVVWDGNKCHSIVHPERETEILSPDKHWWVLSYPGGSQWVPVSPKGDSMPVLFVLSLYWTNGPYSMCSTSKSNYVYTLCQSSHLFSPISLFTRHLAHLLLLLLQSSITLIDRSINLQLFLCSTLYVTM